MELSKELYPRKYWKVEEILFLIFGKCKDKNGPGFVTRRDKVKIEDGFDDAKNFTLYKSEFEKEISKAIDSVDLTEHKALDDDNSDYLDRYDFSNWLLAHKYKIDINHYLYEARLEIILGKKPDYLDFSDRVYGGGTFTRHEAFCYLRGIPINKDKTTWPDDDIRNYLKFDAYENDKEKLNYEEILAIAGKENLSVPREIEIIIEEAKKFIKKNLIIDIEMQLLINELHEQWPTLNHHQLCYKAAERSNDPRNKGKSEGVIYRNTRSPKGELSKITTS